jgi:hypothetical protein
MNLSTAVQWSRRVLHLMWAMLLPLAGPARAGEVDPEISVSGFASLVGGRTQGNCSSNGLSSRYDNSCTRFVADYAHDGVVTNHFALDRESRAGVQLDLHWLRSWSATIQVTARPMQNQHINLEWLYVTYAPSSEWRIQVGRKRLPLYFYSDIQDVGFAYNIVRTSPDVYGWDIVNYNGASLTALRDWGQWQMRAEAYVGSENSHNNPYSQVFSAAPVDVIWSQIAGGYIELSRAWFTTRLSYTHSNYQAREHGNGFLTLFDGRLKAKQDFAGLALNGDWDEWQWRSELGRAERTNASGYTARFFQLALGRRWGDVTLSAGASAYLEVSRFPLSQYVPLRLHSSMAALRWEVHKGGAIKLQWDHVRDRGVKPSAGTAHVVSSSYDLVF